MNNAINKYIRETADRRLKNLLINATALCSMLPEELIKSCLTCDNFNEESEMCKKYNMRPPAKVIAFGCLDYANIYEEIPF